MLRTRPRLPSAIPDTVAGLLEWAQIRWGDDHVIVQDRDGAVELGELSRRVAAGIGALHDLGVRADDRVAATLPNDRTIVELFLATASAGAIWVGIHESLAAPERAMLIDHCEPALSVGGAGGRRAVDAEEWDRLLTARLDDPASPVERDPHEPGAIAYTSGTTGMPKGVVHSQHNLITPAASFSWSGRVPPGERIGVAFPLTILNLMVQSILTALCAGATACVLDRRDAVGILEQVAAHDVEQISIVPTTAYDIVNQTDVAETPSLRRVFVGGSSVGEALLARLAQTLGVVVEHGYGLTEAPGLVTLGVAERPLTAGVALPHLEIAVVDRDGHDIAGGEGEIVLRARSSGPWAGVWTPLLCYWGRSDPPPGHPTELRTADAGVLEPDGRLRVLDRRSELIIRGGSNVYPAEVERALTDHADVATAVVLGRAHDRLGHVPVALVELRGNTSVTADELTAHCRARLAAYKVPEVHIVTDLRRNAMGKVDRARAREQAEAIDADATEV